MTLPITEQVLVSTRQEVATQDLNAISTLLYQINRDFNVNVLSAQSTIINGMKVTWDSGNPSIIDVGAGVCSFNNNADGFAGSLFFCTSASPGITSPNISNPRTDAIDIRYYEAAGDSQTRNFINNTGTVFSQATNTKTISKYDDIVVTPGTASISHPPPSIPSGYVRLATFDVAAGAGSPVVSNITYLMPFLGDEQSWPVGQFPNTFDQEKFLSLKDAISAIRAQISAIIGADTDRWSDVVPISLTKLAKGNSPFTKQGANLRMFDLDTHRSSYASGSLWPNNLNKQGLVVGRGVIGFPDGTFRINTEEKYFDFGSIYTPGFAGIVGTSQRTGFVDTFTSTPILGSSTFLKPNTRYAVFAIADHPNDTDFNIVASEIPFIKTGVSVQNVNSNTQIQATKTGAFASGFFPTTDRKTIVRVAMSPTGITYCGTGLDMQDVSTSSAPQRMSGTGSADEIGASIINDMPQLSSVTNNTIITVGAGKTAVLSGSDSNGSVYVIGGYAPGKSSGTPFSKYRYLGSFLTAVDGTIVPFEIVGEENIFSAPVPAYILTFNFNNRDSVTSIFTLDLAGLVPGTAKNAKLGVSFIPDRNTLSTNVDVYSYLIGYIGRDRDAVDSISSTGSGLYANIIASYANSTPTIFNPSFASSNNAELDVPLSQATFKTLFSTFSSGSNAAIGMKGWYSVHIKSFQENIFAEWARQ